MGGSGGVALFAHAFDGRPDAGVAFTGGWAGAPVPYPPYANGGVYVGVTKGHPAGSSPSLNIVLGPVTISVNPNGGSLGLGPSWPPLWLDVTSDNTSTVGFGGVCAP
jgi:hypothetical protein